MSREISPQEFEDRYRELCGDKDGKLDHVHLEVLKDCFKVKAEGASILMIDDNGNPFCKGILTPEEWEKRYGD